MDIGALIFAIMVVGFMGTPFLAIYSLREWSAARPDNLPAWRNMLGVSSLCTILCGWLFVAVLTVLRFINESWRYLLTERMNIALIGLAVGTIACGIALKGFPRALAIMAGVLFFFLALFASLWLPGDFI
jgi:hypothetical protein